MILFLFVANLVMSVFNIALFLNFGWITNLFCAIFNFFIAMFILGKNMRTEEEIEEYMKEVKEKAKTEKMNDWEDYLK